MPSFLGFYSLNLSYSLACSLLASLTGLTTHCLNDTHLFNDSDQSHGLTLLSSTCSYILQRVPALVPKVLICTFSLLLANNLSLLLLPIISSIYHSSLQWLDRFEKRTKYASLGVEVALQQWSVSKSQKQTRIGFFWSVNEAKSHMKSLLKISPRGRPGIFLTVSADAVSVQTFCKFNLTSFVRPFYLSFR